jgi:hypothetical protein
MAADGLTTALEDYQRVQDELVEARNRLASAIAGAVEDAAGPDVTGELDALAGHAGHDQEPGEALRSGAVPWPRSEPIDGSIPKSRWSGRHGL